MYIPYLRGRQFELLALRELQEERLIGPNVLPIIEPVKLSSTLTTTINSFVNAARPIAIIHNPQVGTFSKELVQLDDSPLTERYNATLASELVLKAHIVNQHSEAELHKILQSTSSNPEKLVFIIKDHNGLDSYPMDYLEVCPRYNLIPDERTFKRKIRHNKVLLEDRFERQLRNVDYANVEDEFFSDTHLFYRDEGFEGFSDYSIVGDQYTESGFAPFAVAIHIVYFDHEDNLRVRHFVSDSNEDINDPAGKFYEALSKLVEWNRMHRLRTRAMEVFEDHYQNGTYPGLGTVKKLSIMHHIELVSNYLDGVQ